MSNKYQPTSKAFAEKQLIQWINEAGMSEGNKKAGLLRKIIEVLMHQLSSLIPLYMENVLKFVNDKTTEVRKIVVGFIEQLSTKHPENIPIIISQLQLLVIDSVIAVQKKAIQAASVVYKNAIIWICKDNSEDAVKLVWDHISKLKLLVLNLIDSENEGIRTHAIKFLEEVVLVQTPCAEGNGGLNLDDIPSSSTIPSTYLVLT
ncbi:unnamed protein product [Leptidea sinapis]|uniref:Symplekin/Pta1 N-terminal domain-containing protein n=1 Tax=Leptidea sinapis TaxID=189913 RepID=A0A5E4QTB3_9NEOP|nr:unnamed protein product [Leptidea sinapis]